MKAFRGVVVLVVAMGAACTAPPQPRDIPVVEPEPVPIVVSDVVGEWTLTVESPMGRDDVHAKFTQAGDQLTGSVLNAGREIPVAGTVQGNVVSFGLSLDVRGQPLHLDYEGTVEGDSMSGTVRFGPIANGKFSGKRKNGGS